MSTLRHQTAWLLCFLIGAWLGMSAGGSSNNDEAKNKPSAASGAQSPPPSSASTPSTQFSASAPPNTTPTKPDKSDKPVKKTSLEDLRRLLALDPYECDLRRLFHDFENFAKGLPAADLPAAAAMLWASPHRMWSMMTLMNILSRWAESDPKAPLDWLRTLKGDEKIVVMMRWNMLSDIGKKHPDLLWEEIGPTQEWMADAWPGPGMIGGCFAGDLKLAQKFLDSITDPSVRYFGLASIIRELAIKDPASAIAWARTQPDSNGKEDAMANAYRKLAEKNPDAALATLNDSRAPLSAQERERVIEGLAEFHPDQMSAFISSGGLKSASMREAGLVGSRSKQAATALLDLAPNIPAGEVRDSFLSSISLQLSEHGDLEGAWKALQDVHPSLERVFAMRNYSESRAKKSIPDSTTWLSSLPPGDDRDAAIGGFAQMAAEKQPQMAVEWAAAIADPVYRQSAVEDSFESWHKSNAKAAEAWLNGAASVSAEEKARLMEKVAEK